jgi:hypothetical protein
LLGFGACKEGPVSLYHACINCAVVAYVGNRTTLFATITCVVSIMQVPGDRPVWRQAMQLHLDQLLMHLYGPSNGAPAQ